MVAFNENFPWMSWSGNYNFYEQKMEEHNQVINIKKVREGLYEVNTKKHGLIKVFICECYSFGVAEFVECVQKLGKIDAIIIDSMWCNYTNDAKEHGKKRKVGVFVVSEFMGAINLKEFWNYSVKKEK